MSIKWLFIVVIVLLVMGISLSNYFLSYYFHKEYISHHLDTVSSYFKAETERIIKPVETFLYNIQALVCCGILDFNDIEKTNRFLMEFMNKYPYITSINYGDGKGNGYLILNNRGKWVNIIKKVEEKGYVTWNIIDKDGKIIKKQKVKDEYDPRNTIWYKQAVHAKDIQWSKEYIFRTTKEPGVTASLILRPDSGEVVGIDMMIKDISSALKRAKENQLIISLFFMFFVLIYITRRYTNPLIEISKRISEVGIKEIKIEKHHERTDEIGVLSRAISDVSIQIINTKELEKRICEAELFESVRRSLGEAVHKFKDLINVIHEFAILAQTKVTNEFAKNALSQITNASEKAMHLAREILTVTGVRKYEIEPLELNSLILSMKTKIESVLADSIKVVFEISEKPLPVKLDIKAFDEVIMNLILNSKDAMTEGGILTVKTKKAYYLDKHYAVLSISDTGTGMDEETKKRIFEPFFTTKGAKGTGLGLSIVYKIVKDHEGFIEVDSIPNKGTTFNLYFPLQQV